MRHSNLSTRPAGASLPIDWSGHLETTSQRLLSILERATTGASDISVAERCLFMACEFWAATKSRNLEVHLGAAATDTLPVIGSIFTAIGAPGVAGDVDVAFADLSASRGAAHRQRCIGVLQNRLLISEEPVDRLLARFAVEIAGNAHARLRRSRIATNS